MSASTTPRRQSVEEQSQSEVESTDSKVSRLLSYLHSRACDEGGVFYFKGKFITDEVQLSTKEIGALLVEISDGGYQTELEIEKWSYTGATTWRVDLPSEKAV